MTSCNDDEPRLMSLLRSLNLPNCAHILDVGCAAWRDLPVYCAVFSTARIVGLDRDIAGLVAAPQGCRVQADMNQLPFRGGFDLVLVRHPDLDRSRSAWGHFLRHAPLNEGGILLISTYTLPEIEQVRGWLLDAASLSAAPLAGERLAPPGLAGRDRFVLVYLRRG